MLSKTSFPYLLTHNSILNELLMTLLSTFIIRKTLLNLYFLSPNIDMIRFAQYSCLNLKLGKLLYRVYRIHDYCIGNVLMNILYTPK